jgi:hypothetical protein
LEGFHGWVWILELILAGLGIGGGSGGSRWSGARP